MDWNRHDQELTRPVVWIVVATAANLDLGSKDLLCEGVAAHGRLESAEASYETSISH
jgi:hypothetical protein